MNSPQAKLEKKEALIEEPAQKIQ